MPADVHSNKLIYGHQCDELCGRIMGMVARGMNATQIAPEVELTRQAVGSRIRRHKGITPKPIIIPKEPHMCNDRCAQILKLRASGMTYAEMAKAMRLTRQRVCQIVVGHNHALKQSGGRSGPSACITCHRKISRSTPDTRMLSTEECCGWCGRRWDGDIRLVTPALIELARKIGTQDKAVAMQHVHTWNPRERRNAAETRARFGGPPDASEFTDYDEPDER